jgi:hypothetical protein
VSYWATKTFTGQEVRLVLFHEANIQAYEYGFAYNRTNVLDRTSAASNGAFGVNLPSDYPLAVNTVSAVIQAHQAYQK